MPVTLLDPTTQTKFSNQLTGFSVIDMRAGGTVTITAKQSLVSLGLVDPTNPSVNLMTTVYGYGSAATGWAMYGPAILAKSGVSFQVQWLNDLPTDSTGHLLPFDSSIDPAMPNSDPNANPGEVLIPTVVHVHGGHTVSNSDGLPNDWITQNPDVVGPGSPPAFFTYDNSQAAATLFYHDHALGYTRLNVYAGLAAPYVIEDNNKLALISAGVLPASLGAFDTPLLIQDKAFTEAGQLYFHGAALDDPIPGGGIVADMLPGGLGYTGPLPSIQPEFFGDFILVNGQAWPYMNVEKGDQVYHLVNGSDSRFYVLRLSDPNVKMTLIGVDGGFMPTARVIMDGDGTQEQGEQIVLAPGDRLDLMLDFSDPDIAVGENIQLLNVGTVFEPFKGLDANGNLRGQFPGDPAPDAATAADSVGQIMEFRVGAGTPFHSTITDGMVLNPGYTAIDPGTADRVRRVGLFETEDQYGRVFPLLGNAEDRLDIHGQPLKAGPHMLAEPVTETPTLGDTEIWEIFNNTADAHPVHMHLVQYQVLGRYEIAGTDLDGDGYLNDLGAGIPLYNEDLGNQDTVWVGPGEALKVIANWDRPGDYVWHCHILSHEEHEMMRPIAVINTVLGDAGNNSLNGTEDADEITGGKGKDTVHGGGGDDRFIATIKDGSDIYYGDDGSDTIDFSALSTKVRVDLNVRGRLTPSWGEAAGADVGADKLFSIENVLTGAGKDEIEGNRVANFLSGGADFDRIDGREGNDRILGGQGDDRLTGGPGSDSFLYYRELGMASIDFGRDTIVDFKARDQGIYGHDVLEIDNRIFGSFAEMVASGAIAQNGRDVVITYDSHNSITLTSVSLSVLTEHAAQDFLFV